jgi:archaetidylinositol phosphate synthase
VTTVRLIVGVAAAICYAAGEAPWNYFGSTLFILSVFLDRADGVLARLSGQSSAWGHTYDLIADSVCNSTVFFGIGVGLRHGALGPWSVPLGLIAGVAVTLVFLMVLRVEDVAGARAGELRGRAGFDPDDAILVVPVAMIFDAGVPLIVAAAVGATLFATFFYSRFRETIRGQTH